MCGGPISRTMTTAPEPKSALTGTVRAGRYTASMGPHGIEIARDGEPWITAGHGTVVAALVARVLELEQEAAARGR